MREAQFFYAEAAAIQDLSRVVQRLGPDYRDPERFHIEKSEIAARLSDLVARLENLSTRLERVRPAPVRMCGDVVG